MKDLEKFHSLVKLIHLKRLFSLGELLGFIKYLLSMFLSSSASLRTAMSRGLSGRRTTAPGGSSGLLSLCLVVSGEEEEMSLCSW